MSLFKEARVKKKRGLSRHEKEMAIQLSEMENYKWLRSEQEGRDVGKRAYFEWVDLYSEQVRKWLEKMKDEEIQHMYNGLSESIKVQIEEKIR